MQEASPDDLARQIERLAADPGLRAEMGRNARERAVAHYSWAHHCAQLEGVLRRICR
jgi:glycosyltransferase involved in cell wall biosynthesis